MCAIFRTLSEKEIRTHLDGLVRQSVEDTLNALLNAEADAICQASRYQRSPDRQDTRAGSYKRKLLTKAGEVELRVPRLRTLPFETQIIESGFAGSRSRNYADVTLLSRNSRSLFRIHIRKQMRLTRSNNKFAFTRETFNRTAFILSIDFIVLAAIWALCFHRFLSSDILCS